jgi:hypothetical protein
MFLLREIMLSRFCLAGSGDGANGHGCDDDRRTSNG